MSSTVEVKGLKETQKYFEEVVRDMEGGPMFRTMRRAVLLVQRRAKKYAPVDTGRLRASITPSVTQVKNILEGVVGSNVHYAPYMEFGTRPHFPPLDALETWARRHDTSAWVVAKAIARRGNIAHFFLQRAIRENADRIYRMMGHTVIQILSK